MCGVSDYQLYKTYRDTESERTLIQQFHQQGDPRLAQMTDWQYDQLRDLLILAESQYPPTNGESSAAYDATVKQAAQFLTPDQLAALSDYLRMQGRWHERPVNSCLPATDLLRTKSECSSRRDFRMLPAFLRHDCRYLSLVWLDHLSS